VKTLNLWISLIFLLLGTPSSAATFRNPLNNGPDPFLVHFEGNYYLTTTQGNAVRIWKSRTINGLKTAQGITVWSDQNPAQCCNIWAAEFHLLNSPTGPRWYLYYTADDNVDAHHRLFVLEGQGKDPLGPYTFKGRLLTDPTNAYYSIDGSILNSPDGNLYLLWAGYPSHRIYISRMSNPWTTIGPRTLIPADGFGCEEVREGPITLIRNGRIFLTYSACDTQKPDYMLGMVVAKTTDDLMKPESWVQFPKPIFARSDANGVFGPGHHGFFKSPDGTEDWIIYHGKTTSAYTYDGRTTRAQKFTWNPDGTPNLGIPLSLNTDIQVPAGDGMDPTTSIPMRGARPLIGDLKLTRFTSNGRAFGSRSQPRRNLFGWKLRH
jgi:GH43 family beta-xylosidase